MCSHGQSVFVKFAKDILTAIRPLSLFTLTFRHTLPLVLGGTGVATGNLGILKGEVDWGNIFSLGPVGYIYGTGHSHVHAMKLLLVILV